MTLTKSKILWLSHRNVSAPTAGGAERTILEVAKRLVKSGIEVTLLTSGNKDTKGDQNVEGIRVLIFGGYLSVHFALPFLLIKNRYTLVVNDLGHAVPWLSTTLLAKNNVVFFRHLHARSLFGQVNKLLATIIKTLEKCYFLIYHRSQFITESTTSAEDLKHLGIRKEKITRILPGVDHEIFKRREKYDFPSIIYFGGMRKYKRPVEVIFIARELHKEFPKLKVYVVGNGPELSKLQQLASKLNANDFVTFKGRIETEELSYLVSKCWLNIHASLTEGWGYTILEAAASGTPTVAYAVPGVLDAIEDGKTGKIVANNDRCALINASAEILKNHVKWSKSAFDSVIEYTWEKTTSEWINMIQNSKLHKIKSTN